MPKILLIEDDRNILTGLIDNLSMEGYQIETASDGNLGLQLAEKEGIDLIILDVMLPGMGGFDVCRRLKEKGNKTPIIILSARGQESDKVLGLELGADDYVSKPFSPNELMMRVKAVLRRTARAEPEGIKFGQIAIDFTRYEVTKNGKGIKLTAISAGDYKLELAPWAPLTAEAKARLKGEVDAVYQGFTAAVARGRGVPVADVRGGYGKGRSLRAIEALAAGLIDGIETVPHLLARLARGERMARTARVAASEPAPIPLVADDVAALDRALALYAHV